MSAPPQIVLGGKLAQVGKRIGKGGEGEVFALGDGQAVKVYSKPDAQREAKIKAMIDGALAKGSDLIAFPSAIARHRNGDFAGFAMRLVKGHTSLHDLYAPGSRKVHFPKADYRFTIRAAANIARAVAKVHELGAVIGDINHSGILISEQAVAALIDADSFQFGPSHLCRVGVAEYTSPELQGIRLDGVVRTPNHDAFGLAVVIFQLLFMGRHPFMGRYSGGDMPLERAIAENRFAYSRARSTSMTPPPGACNLNDFPQVITTALESAFAPNAAARPTALQWAKALEEFERSLTKCSANAMHFFPSAASSCIWCRMEQALGILLFLPTFDVGAGPQIADPGAAGFNLGAVWAAIDAIKLPAPESLTPTLPTISPSETDEATSFKRKHNGQRTIGFIALIFAFGLLMAYSAIWPVYGAFAWFGIVKAFGQSANTRAFTSRYEQAERSLVSAIAGWRERVGIVEMGNMRDSLREAKAELEKLPQTEQRRLAEFEASRKDRQLHDFLETFPIRRASIRGVGPAKIAALASYGIDTAADIVLSRVTSVPGFGEVSASPLMQWRAKVAGRFVFRAQQSPIEAQEIQRIRQSCAMEAANLRAKLLKGANDLQRAASTMPSRLKAIDPVVSRAHFDREQAKVDLEFLKIPVPSVSIPAVRVTSATLRPSPAPARYSPAQQRSGGRSTGTSCPTCGGRMVMRQAKRGYNAGSNFWGCAAYPRCRGTRSI